MLKTMSLHDFLHILELICNVECAYAVLLYDVITFTVHPSNGQHSAAKIYVWC